MTLRSDAVSSVRSCSLIFILLMATAIVASAPAQAQDDTPREPPVEADVFDESESEATVEWVTRALVAIGAGTGLLLVGYIWHTSPRRRLRVAIRRREDREASRRLGLEDEFVLPVEVDDQAGLVADPEAPVESGINED